MILYVGQKDRNGGNGGFCVGNSKTLNAVTAAETTEGKRFVADNILSVRPRNRDIG